MRTTIFFACSLVVGCGGTVAPDTSPSDAGTSEVAVTDSVATPDSIVPPTTDSGGPIDPPPDAGPKPTPGASPPPRPTTASSGSTRWFVVSKLYLGTVDRTTGKSSPTAWSTFGYDIDARTTTADDSKTSTNSCKRAAGAPSRGLEDGIAGRDNNFGHWFMQVIRSLKADAEDAINAEILDGTGSTMILRLDNVGADDNGSVPGALYHSWPNGKPLTFGETEHLLAQSSDVDADKQPLVRFPKGYMSGGVWVSGDVNGDRVLVGLPGFGMYNDVKLDLPQGVISFDVKTGGNGVIAGALPAEALVKGFDPGLRAYGICPGNATYDQVVQTITQSVDVVPGAPLVQDTTRTCTGVSVGIGFDVKPTGFLLGYASTTTPPPDGCK